LSPLPSLSLHDALPIFHISFGTAQLMRVDQAGARVANLDGLRLAIRLDFCRAGLLDYKVFVFHAGHAYRARAVDSNAIQIGNRRSEEHTSELQLPDHLV